MNKTATLALCTLMLAATTGCSDARKKQKEQSERDRATWIAEMKDSVEMLELRIHSNSEQIDALNTDIDQMLPLFKRVDNPRYVEGYYILREWSGRYPVKGTGLTARLMLSEELELIATLIGGVFDRVEVRAGDNSVSTETVPYDQALNYRDGSCTTVAFTGEKADSVAIFIADHPEGDLQMHFINGGKETGKCALPVETRKMIADTWALYDLRSKVQTLERQIPLDNRKINILRQRLETLLGPGAQDTITK